MRIYEYRANLYSKSLQDLEQKDKEIEQLKGQHALLTNQAAEAQRLRELNLKLTEEISSLRDRVLSLEINNLNNFTVINDNNMTPEASTVQPRHPIHDNLVDDDVFQPLQSTVSDCTHQTSRGMRLRSRTLPPPPDHQAPFPTRELTSAPKRRQLRDLFSTSSMPLRTQRKRSPQRGGALVLLAQ